MCLKELYETKYDPLSISYTVLSGEDKIIHREIYYSLNQWFSLLSFLILVISVSYTVKKKSFSSRTVYFDGEKLFS